MKAVLYDVPERPVQIEGPDVAPFMERVFARRISNLAIGRGRYAIACTHSLGGTAAPGYRAATDSPIISIAFQLLKAGSWSSICCFGTEPSN